MDWMIPPQGERKPDHGEGKGRGEGKEKRKDHPPIIIVPPFPPLFPPNQPPPEQPPPSEGQPPLFPPDLPTEPSTPHEEPPPIAASLKQWYAFVDACPICLDNMQVGAIPEDQPFPSGDMEPPAHPLCRCSLQVGHHPLFDAGNGNAKEAH